MKENLSTLSLLIRSSKGSTSVVIVCTTLIIALLAALITDIGYVAIERFKLTKTVEELAYIGAQELVKGGSNAAETVRIQTLKEVNDLNDFDVKIADNKKEITVYIGRPLEYIFLKLIGINEKQITTRVTAKLSNVSAYKGIAPIAVLKQNFTYNKKYILSNNITTSKDTIQIAPLNVGRDNYKSSIIYGYRKKVTVGDRVYALRGDILSDTSEGIQKLISKCKEASVVEKGATLENCPRIVIIPVVDSMDLTGKEPMKVLGFTAFYIEESSINKERVIIEGKFIKHTVSSDISDGIPDFGLSGVRLYH
ncbi:MAG: hypothetical protein N3B21_15620 [Clostridia bacterium]|nr:hypothetical protein [Clostridia bacterium]